MTVLDISTSLTDIRILAEIGVDIPMIEKAKHLLSWTRPSPQNNKSAVKKKTTLIYRVETFLKPLSVKILLAVRKSNNHPELKNKYLS